MFNFDKIPTMNKFIVSNYAENRFILPIGRYGIDLGKLITGILYFC